ncbi:unnamed protein product [Parascedosporium putredinis]|uniref:Translation initiation factor IF2/IF5 domain-containing protein n=1 Tax=Parascedosporium putredinis TaxID=1442378 RepID=A0A9P1GY63_9PEZI|nr:unnamed protein product [Parascedosporium putredinis]CAI7991355.1 unnamed protein product [Parascedosporium putredinis]
MSSVETPQPTERKSRKSVTFTREQLVVDPDGSVTLVNATDNSKETAMSHTPRTPPLSAALESFSDSAKPEDDAAAAPANDDAPEDGGLDLSLLKKKKKKPKKADEGEEEAAADDGGLDLSMKKKKKKKAKEGDEDEFAQKLKALDIEGKEDGAAEASTAETTSAQEGDMEIGTGIWAHDDTRIITYNPLLKRFFALLSQKNPDHALSGTKSYKIPRPNACRMKRTDEHVTAYLFAELGTSGSVDGNRRLVIKGRFQQKQIENVLRKYIIEYVTCKTCKSPDTELSKGENRLYFITCNSCGSRRSVTAIKTGFSAQVGKRKKLP